MPSLFVKPGLIKIVFGVAAVSLTLGAVQFASGHDLSVPLLSGKPGETVNRAAKTDRAVMALAQQAVHLGSPGPDPVYGFGLVGEALRRQPVLTTLRAD